MKVLANKLNFTKAVEMVKGTDLAMYRMAWIEEGFHPAQVALGFDEEADLYDIAEDENYVIAQDDVLANDWVVIAVEDGETIEEDDHDHEAFDDAVLQMLKSYRTLQSTRTNIPRSILFARLGHVFTSYFGEETVERFMETGVLVHNKKCKCPACEQARFEANPKEFAAKKLDEALEGFLELLEDNESKTKESKTKESSVVESHHDELFSLLSAILGE